MEGARWKWVRVLVKFERSMDDVIEELSMSDREPKEDGEKMGSCKE